MEDLLGTALRVSVMYLYALAVLRLAGKRSVGHLTTLDFVVATIVGDLFDDVFWAEVPLAEGVVAFTTVVLVHALVSYASWRSPAIDRLAGSQPTVVVRDGEPVYDGLKRERTPPHDLVSELREQGVDELEEVREARWEPGGRLSVIKRRDAEPADQRDRATLREVVG
jgi:uncharacterized membrane protein YcaP (DUF421 family)